jgi:hypothetical protein
LDLFLHYLRSKNPLIIPDHPNGSASIDDQNLGPVFTLPEEQEPLDHS